MPPPCCMVSAASFKLSKIPAMSSGMVPITKQLNSVTDRFAPAPDKIRPAGRNLKSSMASKKRCSQKAGSSSFSAKALATLRQESGIDLSTGVPSAVFRRYFMSQICCEMLETWAILTLLNQSTRQKHRQLKAQSK